MRPYTASISRTTSSSDCAAAGTATAVTNRASISAATALFMPSLYTRVRTTPASRWAMMGHHDFPEEIHAPIRVLFVVSLVLALTVPGADWTLAQQPKRGGVIRIAEREAPGLREGLPPSRRL